MYPLYSDKSNLFECQIQLEGCSLSEASARLIIESEKNSEKADVFIAMFHDQGLPVIKALGFGETVNITLGLPFIRTSVDHGTAYDISGTGAADESSLLAAIEVAKTMSKKRNNA